MTSLNETKNVTLMLLDSETGDGSPHHISTPYAIAQQIRVGQTNPDYKVKIARRVDASSPYQRSLHNFELAQLSSGASWTWAGVRKYSWGEHRDSCALQPVVNIPTRVTADDIALKRLKGKLARDLDQFKALVPLAEIKETRNLIRTTADATTDLLKALVDLKHGKVKNVANKAGKAWLQFSFAISPTIADTSDLLNSIGSYLTRQDFGATYHGSYKESWFDTQGPKSLTSGCTGTVWDYTPWRRIHNYRVMYSAGVNFDLKSANSYGVQEHFGLDFGEIIPTLWELVPYSWVVDYFTTVGAFLEDSFQAKGGNTYYVTKSVKYTCDYLQELRIRKSSDAYRIERGSNATQRGSTMLFQRTVLTSLPHREMRIKSLDEIGTNGLNRVLNLASILAGGLKSR